MNVTELKQRLKEYPEATVRFQLPNGERIAAHAHVTEVARIDKRFIDCGGTLRNDSICRLQTWIADDVDHRLTAGKLANILQLAAPVLLSDDLEVDVEHEVGVITQMPLESVEASSNETVLRLGERHTACLAMDQCLPQVSVLPRVDPLKMNLREPQAAKGCCSPGSKC